MADECDVVLKGASEILAQGKKLEAELGKCKDAAKVSGGLTAFVTNGDALLKKLQDAMRFKRSRFGKRKAFVGQVQGGSNTASVDSVDQAIAARVDKHLESVQQATEEEPCEKIQ